MAAGLSQAEGQSILSRLVEDTDVPVESFRPGTPEGWNLAPAALD